MNRAPSIFISHGAPDMALHESPWSRALASFGERVRPRAVVVMSGHWEEHTPVRVTKWERARVLHDFSGFPASLYELDYRAPGAPELSDQILMLLERAGIPASADPSRPLDHGVWVPLRFLYPAADVPVIEVSQPVPRSAQDVARIGRALAPLREDGIELIGTGGLVHNLSRARFGQQKAPVDGWARTFEDWVITRLRDRDLETLLSYQSEAPAAPLAAPTPEHFDPLLFAAAAADGKDRLETIYEGFEYGNLSMRTIAFLTED